MLNYLRVLKLTKFFLISRSSEHLDVLLQPFTWLISEVLQDQLKRQLKLAPPRSKLNPPDWGPTSVLFYFIYLLERQEREEGGDGRERGSGCALQGIE